MTKKIKLAILLLFVTTLTFAQNAQRPEQAPPIKGVGIVVKKNPGSGASREAVANTKGQMEITITEKGDYTFTLTELTPAPSGTARNEATGGPVKGVKVGLGKNPPGRIIAAGTTNTLGEVTFPNLEPGNYFIVSEVKKSSISTYEQANPVLIKDSLKTIQEVVIDKKIETLSLNIKQYIKNLNEDGNNIELIGSDKTGNLIILKTPKGKVFSADLISGACKDFDETKDAQFVRLDSNITTNNQKYYFEGIVSNRTWLFKNNIGKPIIFQPAKGILGKDKEDPKKKKYVFHNIPIDKTTMRDLPDDTLTLGPPVIKLPN